MHQIRIHGRGGQGVVTTAELIAIAAFFDGKIAQAFPAFGVERTGAPIESFARINDKPIRTREHIYKPDILIVLDPTLIGSSDITKGCDEKTKIIINTSKNIKELSFPKGKLIPWHKNNIYSLDATKIALDIFGKNIINTTILGAFVKITGLISLASLKKAIREKFSAQGGEEVISKNIKAIEKTYENQSSHKAKYYSPK